jgi:rSAM/selenodomain-associated transferase 1
MNKQTRIVIFAKAPIPGYVKTRLIGALGPEGAAALAAQMLLRTVAVASQAAIGPVELCVAPDPEHVCLRALEVGVDVVWSQQSEGDLGMRMATAVQRTLAVGENVICIGTDCVALTVLHLQMAAIALRENSAVIAPAMDGGYVLLGLSEFDPSIFRDIIWSTDSVFKETMVRIARLNWRVTQLETLRDIDQPEDLNFLPVEFK